MAGLACPLIVLLCVVLLGLLLLALFLLLPLLAELLGRG